MAGLSVPACSNLSTAAAVVTSSSGFLCFVSIPRVGFNCPVFSKIIPEGFALTGKLTVCSGEGPEQDHTTCYEWSEYSFWGKGLLSHSPLQKQIKYFTVSLVQVYPGKGTVALADIH